MEKLKKGSSVFYSYRTYPTPSGHHSNNGTPRVSSRIVPFCGGQLGAVVPATHGVDHVVEDCTAQMFPPRRHRSHGTPSVFDGVVSARMDACMVSKIGFRSI